MCPIDDAKRDSLKASVTALSLSDILDEIEEDETESVEGASLLEDTPAMVAQAIMEKRDAQQATVVTAKGDRRVISYDRLKDATEKALRDTAVMMAGELAYCYRCENPDEPHTFPSVTPQDLCPVRDCGYGVKEVARDKCGL